MRFVCIAVVLAAGGLTFLPGPAPAIAHSGVQYNVTLGDITWLGEVTDAEFKANPKHS